VRCGSCCAPPAVRWCVKGGSHEIWHSPITKRNFAVPIGIPSRHTANAILRQAGLPKAF
jgi:hypothetical protein